MATFHAHCLLVKLVQVIGSDKRLLNPRGAASIRWDVFVAAVLVVTVVATPLSMAFEPCDDALFPFNVAAELTFMSDVVKHFNTGFTDVFGFAIMDRQLIFKQYTSTWYGTSFFSLSITSFFLLSIPQKSYNFFKKAVRYLVNKIKMHLNSRQNKTKQNIVPHFICVIGALILLLTR